MSRGTTQQKMIAKLDRLINDLALQLFVHKDVTPHEAIAAAIGYYRDLQTFGREPAPAPPPLASNLGAAGPTDANGTPVTE